MKSARTTFKRCLCLICQVSGDEHQQHRYKGPLLQDLHQEAPADKVVDQHHGHTRNNPDKECKYRDVFLAPVKLPDHHVRGWFRIRCFFVPENKVCPGGRNYQRHKADHNAILLRCCASLPSAQNYMQLK